MILNKYDWKEFLRHINPFWPFSLMMMKDTKGRWIIVCIKSLLFGGGKLCPKHGNWRCCVCKPKWLCYYPWSKEQLEEFDRDEALLDQYLLDYDS